MTMPIYVLNLDRAPDRLAQISTDLSALGLRFQRWPALDRQTVKAGPVLKTYGNPFGVLGDACCTLSHFDIWRDFVGSGAAFALILEDDARVSGGLKDWVGSRAADAMQTEDLDVLKLEAWPGPGLNRTRPFGQSTATKGVYRLKGRFVGSCAYVIKSTVAKRLLADQTGSGVPIDHVLFDGTIKGLSVGFAAPAPILHDVQTWGSDMDRGPAPKAPRLTALKARLSGARRIEVKFQQG